MSLFYQPLLTLKVWKNCFSLLYVWKDGRASEILECAHLRYVYTFFAEKPSGDNCLRRFAYI
jgi:hypothetical protein